MTDLRPIDKLQTVALFQGLSHRQLVTILNLGQSYRMQQGGFFFYQDDPASSMYVLVTGQVKMTQIGPDGQQVLIRVIGPCEDFGAISALADTPYPLTAKAVTDCRAIGWNGNTLSKLRQQYPLLANNALQLVIERFRELQIRYRELATERTERRLAHALLRLVNQAGRPADDAILIDLALSRRDLAEMTGTTLYTVSRILSNWEKQGWIETGRERIAILQRRYLEAISDDSPLNQ